MNKKEAVYKSEYAKRFVEEVEKYISENNDIGDFATFAVKCNKSKQFFTDLRSSKSDISLNVIDSIIEIFPLDKEYILMGKRQITQVDDDLIKKYKLRNQFLEKELNKAQEDNKTYLRIIENLSRSRTQNLEKEIG